VARFSFRVSQAELKDTRNVRDGYVADRMQLQAVLNAVRKMRNKLLLAHQSTEVKLSTDSKTLLAVLESAISDIDVLHTEIGELPTDLCSSISGHHVFRFGFAI
jgi:hypothetical protein